MRIEIDTASLTVSQGRKVVQLTPVQCELFTALVRAKGRVLSFDYLNETIESVTGKDSGLISLVVHICNIRAKLRPLNLSIENRRGVGYRISSINYVVVAPIVFGEEVA